MPLTPSDGLALTMVATLAFSLGMLFTIFWVMARKADRKPDIEDGLLDEEEQPWRDKKPAGTANQKEPPRQPWEKDSDWWK